MTCSNKASAGTAPIIGLLPFASPSDMTGLASWLTGWFVGWLHSQVALKDLVLGYDRKLSWPQHVVLTAVFVAMTMALAMVFGSDLQAAMAFSGSTSC